MNTQAESDRMPVTASSLLEMKRRREKIAVLTAYDASFAVQEEQAGVDVILVGDSLGMVIQGHDSTLPVRMEDMIYHSACVARVTRRPLIVTDMPYRSYRTPDQALDNARRLVDEGGARMVKFEGGGVLVETARRLVDNGIPVCGHLGLLPQSVNELGGYRVQGRGEEAAARILRDALDLQQAGAAMLVLECIPASLAARISRELTIPVIGIGAGVECDGQVLVLQDMLGITPGRRPKFSRDFLAGAGSVQEAIRAYVKAVREGSFPAEEHTFH